MYNHTKLPPINPVKKDVINTRKKEMYHKIEFEIFPDRDEAAGGENAALLKEMNENLRQHTINRDDPDRNLVRRTNDGWRKRKPDGVYPNPVKENIEL